VSRALVYVLSLFGTSQGGMMVEVTGSNHDALRTHRLSVFADERGEIIPAILPSLAAQMILQGEISYQGIVPLPNWLPRERFTKELAERHLRMAEKRDGDANWVVGD